MSSGIKINSIGAVSGTMETRSMQPMYPTKNAATIVLNSAPRSALNGRQSLNISINPTANATMTESVETCGFVKFSGPLNSVKNKTPRIIVRAEGNDLQKQRCRALQIVDGAPAFLHHLRHGSKVGVEQNEVRDRTRRVAAGSHRNAAIGLFQRQNVVHTVARHRHRVAVVF